MDIDPESSSSAEFAPVSNINNGNGADGNIVTPGVASVATLANRPPLIRMTVSQPQIIIPSQPQASASSSAYAAGSVLSPGSNVPGSATGSSMQPPTMTGTGNMSSGGSMASTSSNNNTNNNVVVPGMIGTPGLQGATPAIIIASQQQQQQQQSQLPQFHQQFNSSQYQQLGHQNQHQHHIPHQYHPSYQHHLMQQQQQLQGRSMPVSPTFLLSPNGQMVTSVSGPPTPSFASAGPNNGGNNAISGQQQQPQYQSPSTSTTSSTTSFLANQHQQHNPPPNASNPGNQITNHRMALNDAFSYLDRVKSEFASQPEVYNKFLQVMREFKANVIDANGVIVRVVQLFRGHRDLILGFNAFLPKTHHIDPIVAETGELPASFLVSNSTGASAVNVQSQSSVKPSSSWIPGQPPIGRPPIYPNTGGISSASVATSYQSQSSANSQPQLQHPQPQLAVGPGPVLRKSSNAQFAKAISFVKRVKQRFVNDPESYKTFLSSLHSFQKDQRSVAEVCTQVQRLFSNQPDLLEEFMQFLPENDSGAPATKSRLPPMGQFAAAATLHKFEPANQPSKSTDGIPVVPGAANKRSRQPSNQLKRSSQQQSYQQQPQNRHFQSNQQITKTAEEVEFFEKVKRHLGNRQVYAEFLKCLNMYSQNILRLGELIQLVSGFIGGSEELFGWFKRYIGYNAASVDGNVAALEATNSSAATMLASSQSHFIHGPHDEINLNSCKRAGSYRLLPPSYKLAPSSGRTELCKEVLNDQMISCPTFESEDSTFVSSKKNAFEEALFRCEDERFELDLLIDGNRATIAVLEPLSKLSDFNALDAKLNGTSAMIYKRTIKRIYGTEKGEEVYEALQKNPTVSIPIVLKRLKQKDEEWQKARREWQRVWRDVHVRNYYRSLDHQSIDFRQTDRRSCSTKALLQELEMLFEEERHVAKRSFKSIATTVAKFLSQRLPAKGSPVYTDTCKLLFTALKHSGSIPSGDRRAVKSMLCRILGCIFSPLASSSFSAVCLPPKPDCSGQQQQRVVNVGSSGTENDSENDSNAENVEASDTASRNFYLNGAMYGIVRMFGIVMERLEKMRILAVESNNTPYSKEKMNVVAKFLDLTISDDVVVECSALSAGGGDDNDDGHSNNNDMYRALVKLLKRLLVGDCEVSLFEEQVRFMFGLEAYVVFTVDRLLHSILRQTHALLPSISESTKGEQLVRLLEDSHRLPEYTCRVSAETLLASVSSNSTGGTSVSMKDRLVKVRIDTGQSLVQFSLPVSHQLDSAAASPEQRWSAYVDSFIRLDVNPLYADGEGKGVFLKKSLRAASSPSARKYAQLIVQYNLECKICIDTYKLFYVEYTEDFVHRAPLDPQAVKGDASRGARFRHWLQQFRWQN